MLEQAANPGGYSGPTKWMDWHMQHQILNACRPPRGEKREKAGWFQGIAMGGALTVGWYRWRWLFRSLRQQPAIRLTMFGISRGKMFRDTVIRS